MRLIHPITQSIAFPIVTDVTASTSIITVTNLAWPSDLSTRWSFSGSAAGVTRTRVSEENPSGNPGTYRFERTSEGTAQFGPYYSDQVVFEVGKVYTCSLWMRGLNGGESVRFAVEGTVEGNARFITLSAQWQRFAVTAHRNVTTGTLVAYMQDGGLGSGFLVTGGQIEQSNFSGPFVPTTTGPVTKTFQL